MLTVFIDAKQGIDYIYIEKGDECYKSLLNDVYYFNNGRKPDENEIIITKDDDKWNMYANYQKTGSVVPDLFLLHR